MGLWDSVTGFFSDLGDFFSGKDFFEAAGYAWNDMMKLAADVLTKNPSSGTYKDVWKSISTIYTTLNVVAVSFPIIYSMDVEPLDNDVAYQMVMKKYMSNERSINREQELKNENGDYSTNINYERRKQQRDTEEMLDRISSFDERLLYVGITIVVKAGSMEELEERTEKVRIIGKTHNMDIVPHSYRQLDALNTSLPTGARFVDTMRTITSEELSIFIPFNVQEIHDDLGYCYGFNKVSKNLIIGNRKLLKNGNGMVFGVPGSGKSYNEKSEMGQVLCFSKG